MDYLAIFEEADDGSFSVYVPDLPGCVSSGDTLEEAEAMIREAIDIYLNDMRADGEPVPAPTTRAKMVHAAA